jgi:hypothetical protein
MIDRNFRLHLKNGTHLRYFAQREFVKAMRTGRMIAFVGSMATEDLGQPSWTEFLGNAVPKDKLKKDKVLKEVAKNLRAEITKARKPTEPQIGSDDLTLYFDILRDILSPEPEKARKDGEPWSETEIAKLFELKNITCWKDRAITALLDELGVRRIITTNYDMEFEWHWLLGPIERASNKKRNEIINELIDPETPNSLRPSKDYRKTIDYRLARTFADGSYAVSDCFQRERTDRLFELSIGSPDNARHILHLHGRASDPETLIVSYSEYERQYRQSHIAQLPFQHGLSTLFAGNPILFVGLGLNERELTATLEQFVSDNKRSHIAPAFVIWSPQAESKEARTEGSVDTWDEIRRLKFFRRYGVLTIYDVELEGFSETSVNLPTGPEINARKERERLRLAGSLAALAKHTAERVSGFPWESKHFRDMSGFLESATAKGAKVWGVKPNGSTFDPGFELPSEDCDKHKKPHMMDDPEYLLHFFERTPPIKAFLDPPGSGHGYLSKVLGGLITGELRKRHKNRRGKDKTDVVYCQFNAGFSWEIDTTFSLVSGLYDDNLAVSEATSRDHAIETYGHKIMETIAKAEPASRSIFLAINGVDRFFDSSGYPLSHELDLLIRGLHLLHNPPGQWVRSSQASKDRHAYLKWKDDFNDLHPFNLLLFGTRRVGRYLAALETSTIESRELGNFVVHRTGMVRGKASELPKEIRHSYQVELHNQTYAIYGTLPRTLNTGEPAEFPAEGGRLERGLSARIWERWQAKEAENKKNSITCRLPPRVVLLNRAATLPRSI